MYYRNEEKSLKLTILAHQNACGIERNCIALLSFSAKYAKLENNNINIAKNIRSIDNSL
jgi:hypothetical protein